MNVHIIKISFTFQRIRNELHFWHCEDLFIAKIHLNGLRINIHMKWQSDNLLASFLFVVRKLLSGQTSEPYPGFLPSLLISCVWEPYCFLSWLCYVITLMWVCCADPWHLPYSTMFPTSAMGGGNYRNCRTLPLAKEGKMVSIIVGRF